MALFRTLKVELLLTVALGTWLVSCGSSSKSSQKLLESHSGREIAVVLGPPILFKKGGARQSEDQLKALLNPLDQDFDGRTTLILGSDTSWVPSKSGTHLNDVAQTLRQLWPSSTFLTWDLAQWKKHERTCGYSIRKLENEKTVELPKFLLESNPECEPYSKVDQIMVVATKISSLSLAYSLNQLLRSAPLKKDIKDSIFLRQQTPPVRAVLYLDKKFSSASEDFIGMDRLFRVLEAQEDSVQNTSDGKIFSDMVALAEYSGVNLDKTFLRVSLNEEEVSPELSAELQEFKFQLEVPAPDWKYTVD